MYVSDLLNAFSCLLNHDVEDFLRNPSKALTYEKSDMGRTYLLYDRQAMERPSSPRKSILPQKFPEPNFPS